MLASGRNRSRPSQIGGDLVVSGASNKSIAEQLAISVRTVVSHVVNILRKLEVSARRDVAKALDRLRG